jgi:hypothetical protein
MIGDLGVVWGISRTYNGRAHVVPRGWKAGLCTLPVDDKFEQRPYGYRICPECAIAWVSIVFPAVPPDPASSSGRISP